MTDVSMVCKTCKYEADHSQSARFQWDQLDEHYKLFHDKRRNPMAPTMVQQIWIKLDEVMEQALTWQGVGKNKVDPDSWANHDWAADRFDYLTRTSVGRGLAEALVILCQPAFENSSQVVKLAAKRYKAKLAGEELPSTPGFMGPGTTGDDLRLAGQGKEANVQYGAESNVSTETQSTIPVPTPAGPKKKAKLNDSAIAAIKKGLANGFDIETFSDMYKVSVEDIREAVA